MSSSCMSPSIFSSLIPSPPLHSGFPPPLCALVEDRGWLLWLMALRREGKDGRWSGQINGCDREMTGCRFRFSFFRYFACCCGCKLGKESSGHVEWTSDKKKNWHKTQSGCRNNNSSSKSVMAVQVGDVFHTAACCKGWSSLSYISWCFCSL